MKSPNNILLTLLICLIFSGCSTPTDKSALHETDLSSGSTATATQDSTTPASQVNPTKFFPPKVGSGQERKKANPVLKRINSRR